MLRRVLVVVAITALVVGALSGVAVAKKKKKSVIQPGVYPGTTVEGIPMSVTLDRSRTSGTFTYCEAQVVPFTVSGNSFSISFLDPGGSGLLHISATGTFRKSKTPRGGTVSGSIPLGGGCSGSAQTFSLRHG